MSSSGQTATILFTDLVDSTELLQRVGDERAQRIFAAHDRVLRDAVVRHHGGEVRWTGDGLLVAFTSTVDAVRCAIAMQRAARLPQSGERLRIRAGLNAGETLRHDASDLFGTTVVVASRICHKAAAGEILASGIVRVLLAGHGDLRFEDRGAYDLKGIAEPVPVCEVLYEHDPLAALRQTPFVGRLVESAALRTQLDAARTGKGGVALLVGEPGIGKTRIAEEFCDEARNGGALVLWGRCYDGEWAPPFSPFVEAIKDYARQADAADVRSALGPSAGVLSRIVPTLRDGFGDISEPPALQPEGERYRVLEAMSDFFATLCAKQPVVLVLDDLHWAETGTIAMLGHVARSAKDERLLILGAYRDVEVDAKHPLTSALADLRRHPNTQRISLVGLGAEAVGELLEAVAQQAVPAALVEAIGRETSGNPFFIREVLLHLVEEGKIVREDGVWTTSLTIEEMGVPESVREVIARRIARLSAAAARLLTTASAMSGGFSWPALVAISADEEDVLLDALDEALAAGLIAEHARENYDFTHALIRHTLYDELSSPRRTQLHRQIGEALERMYTTDVEIHLPELADHFYRAISADAEKAIEYATRAGDGAMQRHAYQEAAAHYRHALDALAFSRNSEDVRRCRLLLHFGHAAARTTEPGEARPAFLRAAEIARERGDAAALAEAALGLGAGQIVPEVGTLDEVHVRLLEDALAVLGEGDPALRALLLASLSVALIHAPTRGRVQGLLEEAITLARKSGASGALACASLAKLYTMSDRQDAAQRLSQAQQAQRVATEAGDAELTLNALAYEFPMALELGDIDEATNIIEQYASIVAETRNPGHQWFVPMLRAALALLRGAFAENERLAAEALALGEQAHAANARQAAALHLFIRRGEQGGLEDLEPVLRALSDAAPALWGGTHGMLLCRIGRPEEARAALERAVPSRAAGASRTSETEIQEERLSSLVALSNICVALDDAGRAATLYAELAPFAARYIVVYGIAFVGSGSQALGSLAATMRRWPDAFRHFEDALDMNTRVGARPWVARTQHEYAEALMSHGGEPERTKAVALLSASIETAKELHMQVLIAQAEDLLATAHSHTGAL